MKKLLIFRVLLSVFLILYSSFTIAQKGTGATTGLKSTYTTVVGEQFTCQSTIKTMLTVVLKYKLSTAPSSMSIDSLTGVVKWTPAAKGEFKAEICAYAGTSKIGTEALAIKVVGFLGTISGTVKNDDGKPLKNIKVSLFKKVAVKTSLFPQIVYSTFTDSLGAYTITKIDSGGYFVQARSYAEKLILNSSPSSNFEYAEVWYVDSPTMDKASEVPVSSANKIVINLTMHKFVKPAPVEYFISGKVTNADGNPIKDATVIVELAAKFPSGGIIIPAGAIVSSYMDKSLGVFANTMGQLRTDANGLFKIGVRGGTYLVSAFALGFQIQYYNGKNNVLEADKITVAANVGDVNFRLTALPLAKAKISGLVTDSTNKAVISKVVLYPVGSIVYPQTKTARSAATDTLGNFVFENAAAGKYLVQAVPLKGYLPGWYKANSCGIRELINADTVVIKNDLSITGIKICVKKASATGGGKIAGKISTSGNTGLAGVIVYAVSSDQYACSFGISNSDGSFEIADLDPDNYNTTAEKVGFNTVTKSNSIIDYSRSIFNASVNFSMTGDNAASVEPDAALPQSFALYQNYPNPFNPVTVITYQVPASGLVSLKVYDVLGHEVASLVNNLLPAGTYKIEFNASNLSSGVYFYQLNTGEYSTTKKLILMK